MSIKEECVRHAWAMRGGIQYNEIMNLSFEERVLLNKLHKENIKTTSESGLPFF